LLACLVLDDCCECWLEILKACQNFEAVA
jgi:hypothetical protein